MLSRNALPKGILIQVLGHEVKLGLFMVLQTVSFCSSLRELILIPSAVYNWTQNPDFLDTSRKLATFFLDNIPSDGIIPW